MNETEITRHDPLTVYMLGLTEYQTWSPYSLYVGFNW